MSATCILIVLLASPSRSDASPIAATGVSLVALEGGGPREAESLLKDLNSSDPKKRLAAAQALGSIGVSLWKLPGGIGGRAYSALLRLSADDPDPAVRAAALRAAYDIEE